MLHDNEIILDQVNYTMLYVEAAALDIMQGVKGHLSALATQVARQNYVYVPSDI